MSKHLTPLEVCEWLLAPIEELAMIAGASQKAGYPWRRSSGWRDAGDMPPRANRRLLAWAARHERPVTADHLIWGAPLDEVRELAEQIDRPMPLHLRDKFCPRTAPPSPDAGQVAAE